MFQQNNIHLAQPANINTNGYCVPKNRTFLNASFQDF